MHLSCFKAVTSPDGGLSQVTRFGTPLDVLKRAIGDETPFDDVTSSLTVLENIFNKFGRSYN